MLARAASQGRCAYTTHCHPLPQVKGALEGAYTQNQELSKQIGELEALCADQQTSLEEGEERYRRLADTHDALRHAGLQAKAQLITAQSQVRRWGAWEQCHPWLCFGAAAGR